MDEEKKESQEQAKEAAKNIKQNAGKFFSRFDTTKKIRAARIFGHHWKIVPTLVWLLIFALTQGQTGRIVDISRDGYEWRMAELLLKYIALYIILRVAFQIPRLICTGYLRRNDAEKQAKWERWYAENQAAKAEGRRMGRKLGNGLTHIWNIFAFGHNVHVGISNIFTDLVDLICPW